MTVTKVLSSAHHEENSGRKVLLFVYYVGYGALKGNLNIVLNQKNLDFRYWPLEQNLSRNSNYKNTYTVALLDCDRSI